MSNMFDPLFAREAGDAALLAKALSAYRPETTEEESIVQFYIEELKKVAAAETEPAT